MDLSELRILILLPELITAGGGLLVLLLGALGGARSAAALRWCSMAAVLAAALFCVFPVAEGTGYFGAALADPLAFAGRIVVLVTLFLLLLGGEKYLEEREVPRTEYHGLALFAATGMLALASAGDLIVIFLAVEIFSISLYSMAGLLGRRPGSREAAIKYFITGSFASGFLLFGMALIFGAGGSTNLSQIGEVLARENGTNWIALGGALLMMTGFLFKVAAVPFHNWAPDVYEGSPTAVTAFMSTAAKAAAFAGFGRVILPLTGLADDWVPLLGACAALTMILGNLAALVQENVKRMLAYSSVAHAGYLLLGVIAAGHSPEMLESVIFYLLPYALVNVAMFLIAAVISRHHSGKYLVEDYKGLARQHPFVALLIGVFVFALAGIPPTAGFMGKFFLFSAAMKTGHVGLAVLGVLTSVVSVFYYLRLVVYAYFHEPVGLRTSYRFPPDLLAAGAISTAGILLLGVWPGLWLQLTRGIGL